MFTISVTVKETFLIFGFCSMQVIKTFQTESKTFSLKIKSQRRTDRQK